jgi:hypothetical protein
VHHLADVVGGGAEQNSFAVERQRRVRPAQPIGQRCGDVVHQAEVRLKSRRGVHIGQQGEDGRREREHAHQPN